jgi:hypothetical protein
MTSPTQYAPRRAFSNSARHLRDRSTTHREAAPGCDDLFPDELLPDRFSKRDERRQGLQQQAVRMSLVGLALVIIIGLSFAFVLSAQAEEPFAVQSEAEIVTVTDVPSLG